MRNIIITDGIDSVSLLSDLEFQWVPKLLGETAVMASGKTVKDVIGIKNTLTIPTGWLSAADLRKLKSMITRNVTLTVMWPSVDGDRSDICFIDLPQFKSFKYGADGVEQWYGVTLNITQAGTDPVR